MQFINSIFGIFIKHLLKYVLFVLPFILVFKSLYICWQDAVLTIEYFSQQFISNIPFLGERFSCYIWGEGLSLDKIQSNQNITQLILIGGLGGCLGKTIFEIWFSDSDYFKVPAVAGPEVSGERPGIKIPLILHSTQNSDLNLGSASANVPVQDSSNVPVQGSSNVPPVKGSINDMSSSGYWKKPLKTFKEEISPCFEGHTLVLKTMNAKALLYTLEVPENNDDPSITEASLANNLLGLLQTHAKIVESSFSGRDGLLNELRHFLSEEDKSKIEEISRKKDQAYDDYLEKVGSLGEGKSDTKVLIKLFHDHTNAYRNIVKKELAKGDEILKKGIKTHPVYAKHPIKHMINRDYPKLIRDFQREDDQLRKRYAELFNKPKSKK
jgi:hypothetical protein